MRYLITGGHGQDGLILSEILLDKGDVVFSLSQKKNQMPDLNNAYKLRLLNKLNLFKSVGQYIDYSYENYNQLVDILHYTKPNAILHFAAIHGSSETMPTDSQSFSKMREVHLGMTEIFIDFLKMNIDCKLLVAGSSKMFKLNPGGEPINNNSEFELDAKQYYAFSKYLAYKTLCQARIDHNINASMLFLFNHESPLRGRDYLSRTISIQLARILRGEIKKLMLKDINVAMDVSDARDLCEWVVSLSKLDRMKDFVLGSGKLTNIKESIRLVCKSLNITLPQLENNKVTEKIQRPIADITELRKSIILKPTREFESTLTDMVINDLIII